MARFTAAEHAHATIMVLLFLSLDDAEGLRHALHLWSRGPRDAARRLKQRNPLLVGHDHHELAISDECFEHFED